MVQMAQQRCNRSRQLALFRSWARLAVARQVRVGDRQADLHNLHI